MSGVSVVRILRGNDVTPLPVRYVSGPAAFLVTGYVNYTFHHRSRGKKEKHQSAEKLPGSGGGTALLAGLTLVLVLIVKKTLM